MLDWLLLISSLPSENASLRTKLWRLFKAIGAHPLRDGVYLLPNLQQSRSSFERIYSDITMAGGAAWLLETRQPDGENFADFFDRSAEYAMFLNHLDVARTDAVSSPADAERLLKRLQKEFDQIESIDFFRGVAHAQAFSSMTEFADDLSRLLSPNEPQFAEGSIEQLSIQDFQAKTWATRKNMWVDRMACAWLIQRFIDPQAAFVWLDHPTDCPTDAIGFDFDGAHFTHIDSKVSFEVLIAAFGLRIPGLAQLANIIRFLDVGGIPVPEAPGVERTLAGIRSLASDDDQLVMMVKPIFDALLFTFQNDNE